MDGESVIREMSMMLPSWSPPHDTHFQDKVRHADNSCAHPITQSHGGALRSTLARGVTHALVLKMTQRVGW